MPDTTPTPSQEPVEEKDTYKEYVDFDHDRYKRKENKYKFFFAKYFDCLDANWVNPVNTKGECQQEFSEYKKALNKLSDSKSTFKSSLYNWHIASKPWMFQKSINVFSKEVEVDQCKKTLSDLERQIEVAARDHSEAGLQKYYELRQQESSMRNTCKLKRDEFAEELLNVFTSPGNY